MKSHPVNQRQSQQLLSSRRLSHPAPLRPPCTIRSVSNQMHATPDSQPTSESPQSMDFSLMPFIQQVKDKKFHCTMCGICCTGKGEVWVTSEEVDKIATHLGLNSQAFLARYTKQYDRIPGHHLLKNKQDLELSCIFLEDKKCSIHTCRPAQCRTYPWWPELMESEGWQREKAEICEGFDHPEAGELDLVSAAMQLRESTAAEQVKQIARGRRTSSGTVAEASLGLSGSCGASSTPQTT